MKTVAATIKPIIPDRDSLKMDVAMSLEYSLVL